MITGTVTTWPLTWGPIVSNINSYQVGASTPFEIIEAIDRVRRRASWEMQTDQTYFDAGLSLAEKPIRLRGYQNTPRNRAEINGGVTYTSDFFVVAVQGQIVDSSDADDSDDFRADGSVAGFMLGNFSITANTLDRWWGPGWDGSLILSNNARPIPSLSIDRNFTDPFRTPWLRWLGPWDFSTHFGQLEDDRAVPNAQFWGFRFNFRPIPALEIRLSRSAQWCGDDRPCNSDAFVDLVFGRDNRGDDDIDDSNEPGNQLAGVDFRWATTIAGRPLAFYGQFIGEDEAGGLPSRYLGQIGIDGTAVIRNRWTMRWFGEVVDTKCRFYESDIFPNCAYNHSIYQTGYRYKGRAIGHASDNDARLLSLGLTLVDGSESEWSAVLRLGQLNRIGVPDPANSLSPTSQDIASIDLRHSRAFTFGEVTAGVGVQTTDDEQSGDSRNDISAFFQWRSSY